MQKKYEILLANFALRAIPLEAGAHHFRIEYLPPAFVYARITTIVSLLLLIALTITAFARQRNRPSAKKI